MNLRAYIHKNAILSSACRRMKSLVHVLPFLHLPPHNLVMFVGSVSGERRGLTPAYLLTLSLLTDSFFLISNLSGCAYIV